MCWVKGQRKIMNVWVSAGPILHCLLSLSQLGASFLVTCGSLPSADLPCCLCLLPILDRWVLIISSAICMVSLLGRRA